MYKQIPITMLLLVPMAAETAGFDCGKASTKIEKLICQNTELSKLDSKMSQSYEQALIDNNGSLVLKEQQRRWLRDIRNRCSDSSCLESAYMQRIFELSSVATGMTNEKEKSICKAVVDAVNDGSIANRIMPFEKASSDDMQVWAENRSNSSSISIHRTLKINAHRKSITL